MDWFLYSTILLYLSTYSTLHPFVQILYSMLFLHRCFLSNVHTHLYLGSVSFPRMFGMLTEAARNRTTKLPISKWLALPPGSYSSYSKPYWLSFRWFTIWSSSLPPRVYLNYFLNSEQDSSFFNFYPLKLAIRIITCSSFKIMPTPFLFPSPPW